MQAARVVLARLGAQCDKTRGRNAYAIELSNLILNSEDRSNITIMSHVSVDVMVKLWNEHFENAKFQTDATHNTIVARELLANIANIVRSFNPHIAPEVIIVRNTQPKFVTDTVHINHAISVTAVMQTRRESELFETRPDSSIHMIYVMVDNCVTAMFFQKKTAVFEFVPAPTIRCIEYMDRTNNVLLKIGESYLNDKICAKFRKYVSCCKHSDVVALHQYIVTHVTMLISVQKSCAVHTSLKLCDYQNIARLRHMIDLSQLIMLLDVEFLHWTTNNDLMVCPSLWM